MATRPLTPHYFQTLLQQGLVDRTLCSSPFVVGFSGGLDSTVLLHLCWQLHGLGVIRKVRAIHIHHGLSYYADDWADHAGQVCRGWDIPLEVHRVSCNGDANIEKSARDARYQVFEHSLKGAEILLQAHHQDDQIETLLYRLLRGTGLDGMGGIPFCRTVGNSQLLLRPLLDMPRSALEEYASQAGLVWIEDDSNGDTRFDRNFLRAEVIPPLTRRWPGAKQSLSRFGVICRESIQLLNELAQEDFAHAITEVQLPGLGSVTGLDGLYLQAMSLPRRNLLLRYWLMMLALPVPDRASLERIFIEVVCAREDGEPVIHWHGMTFYRYKNYQRKSLLLAIHRLPAPGGFIAVNPNSLAQIEQVVCRMEGNGEVCAHASEPIQAGQASGTVVASLVGQWSLRRDVTVEPFSLPGRKGRKSLKKWLNELGVPAWLRARLPVLHRDTTMVAIPGVLVADNFSANQQAGWVLQWTIGNKF